MCMYCVSLLDPSDGISDGAFRAKGLPPIRPFSIIKDQKENVLGGASGTLFYGSLYVDSLWVDKPFA